MSVEHLGLIICFLTTMKNLIFWASPAKLSVPPSRLLDWVKRTQWMVPRVSGHPSSYGQALPDLDGKSHQFQSLLHGFCTQLPTLIWSRTSAYAMTLKKARRHSISVIKINFQDTFWKYAYILKINHTKESKQKASASLWYQFQFKVNSDLWL